RGVEDGVVARIVQAGRLRVVRGEEVVVEPPGTHLAAEVVGDHHFYVRSHAPVIMRSQAGLAMQRAAAGALENTDGQPIVIDVLGSAGRMSFLDAGLAPGALA